MFIILFFAVHFFFVAHRLSIAVYMTNSLDKAASLSEAVTFLRAVCCMVYGACVIFALCVCINLRKEAKKRATTSIIIIAYIYICNWGMIIRLERVDLKAFLTIRRHISSLFRLPL